MNNIINKNHDKIPEIYSENLKYLIDIMLTKNQEKRPMISELLNLNDFIKEKYKVYKENKNKLEINCRSEREQKSIRLKSLILLNNDEKLIKQNSSSYFSNGPQNNPFDNFENNNIQDTSQLEKNKNNFPRNQTPIKKIKISNLVQSNFTSSSTNDSSQNITSAYISNSEIAKSSIKNC